MLIEMCLNKAHNKVRRGKHLSDAFPIQISDAETKISSVALAGFVNLCKM
jgi:hypothetical protein